MLNHRRRYPTTHLLRRFGHQYQTDHIALILTIVLSHHHQRTVRVYRKLYCPLFIIRILDLPAKPRGKLPVGRIYQIRVLPNFNIEHNRVLTLEYVVFLHWSSLTTFSVFSDSIVTIGSGVFLPRSLALVPNCDSADISASICMGRADEVIVCLVISDILMSGLRLLNWRVTSGATPPSSPSLAVG